MDRTGPAGTTGKVGLTRKLAVGTAIVVVPVLAAAWVVLYLFPTRTESLWAWPIGTRMTPITIGAGYLGGVWFFVRVIGTADAHRHRGGFLGVSVLTTGLAIATALHWDAFHHQHISFWAWLFLYAVTPVVFTGLFVSLHRQARRPVPEEPRLPPWLRMALGGVGAVQVVAATLIFVAPDLVIRRWPWAMTFLTVRSIAPFIAFTGVLALWALVDDRYSALRNGVESTLIGLAAIAIGAISAAADFTGPAAARWGYVGALIGLSGLLLAFVWKDPVRRDRRLLTR